MEPEGRKNLDWLVAVGLIAVALFVVMAVVMLVVVLPSDNINLFGIGLPDHTMKVKIAGDNVSDGIVSQTESILQERFDYYEYDMKMETLREQGDVFLLISYDDIPDDIASYIVTTQGLFTLQVQGQDLDDRLVVNNSGLAEPRGDIWEDVSGKGKVYSIMLRLTGDGAVKFREACLKYGAVDNPTEKNIVMRLDGESIYEARLNYNLANSIRSGPVDLMLVNTGIGDDGYVKARRISVILQSGLLPARLEIVPV